jgi:hypothetical protein
MFSSVKSAVCNACTKSYVGIQACAAGIKSRALSERGEVNVVAIVVLIGVAVVLALLFREAISGILETLFKSISGNASKAVTP